MCSIPELTVKMHMQIQVGVACDMSIGSCSENFLKSCRRQNDAQNSRKAPSVVRSKLSTLVPVLRAEAEDGQRVGREMRLGSVGIHTDEVVVLPQNKTDRSGWRSR